MALLPLPELLAGLAEEAAELSQAALKLRRVYDGQNPTPPLSIAEGQCNLEEEIADVLLYLDQIPYTKFVVDRIKETKLERWKKRLEMKEG